VFGDPHAVRVRGADRAERVLYGDVILIATGSVPTRAKEIAFADPRVHDSDEILAMERLPATLAVIGAGVIGCEYATMFAALGIAVTLIDSRHRLLGVLDGEFPTACACRCSSSTSTCAFAKASCATSPTPMAYGSI
jgi:NAD(P) transhydrogenase